MQTYKYWGPPGSDTIYHILKFKGFRASAGEILDRGLHQDYSAQVRVWTTEANSFWDSQEAQSFSGSPLFGPQISGHLPVQRIGVHLAQECFAWVSAVDILVPGHHHSILHRWECGLQRLTASVTGQSNTASGTGPILGLPLCPGGRSKCQISVHLPCKRRACLQRVLWPLKLRGES